MNTFNQSAIKWPYVTHLVDHRVATAILPPIEETRPGALMLARVVSIGRHRELEAHGGRRMALYEGDVFACVLGNRYATDQFEAIGRCAGQFGHIAGIGGVCGEVISMNSRMTEPTIIEWLGRLAGPDGEALHLSRFQIPDAPPKRGPRATAILSLGASMNAGKTTTAAQIIRSLTVAGHRVAAAKITGTACVKDPNFLRDAGAVAVYDFTHVGWPSTAGCSQNELLTIAAQLRRAMAAHVPEFVVIEIADGIVQRETAMLLAHEGFRTSIDAVTFAAPDALSCDAGVRRLRELGYPVVATAGFVANGRLGVAEAEEACGVRCLDGPSLLAGTLVSDLRAIHRKPKPGQTASDVARSDAPARKLAARPGGTISGLETVATVAPRAVMAPSARAVRGASY